MNNEILIDDLMKFGEVWEDFITLYTYELIEGVAEAKNEVHEITESIRWHKNRLNICQKAFLEKCLTLSI